MKIESDLKTPIIVTTSHSVILFDAELRNSTKIHYGSGLYYGIAELNEYIYIACRNNLNCYDNDKENCQLIVFDRAFKEVKRISPSFEFGDVHGILTINNEIWCTSTADNSIAIWNSESNIWRKWYPLSERGQDINHFNTIVKLCKNRIGLVAHNKGDSVLYTFDLEPLQLLETKALGVHAHNFWLDNNHNVFTCSSALGYLINSNSKIIQIGSFPRGVAYNGRHYLVGVSELSSREKRNETNGYIRIYDKDWLHMYDIILPEEGMVLDILPLKNKVLNIKSNSILQTIESVKLDVRYLGSEQADFWLNNSEWSEPEEYRWTISKKSTVNIAYNHYHKFMEIHGYNEHYINEDIFFSINDEFVGKYKLEKKGKFDVLIKLPKNLCNINLKLIISVPYLVLYSNKSKNPERNLGIAIKSIKYIK